MNQSVATIVGKSVPRFPPKGRNTELPKHRSLGIGRYRYEDRHAGDAEGWCDQNHAFAVISPSRHTSMASGPQCWTLTNKAGPGIGGLHVRAEDTDRQRS